MKQILVPVVSVLMMSFVAGSSSAQVLPIPLDQNVKPNSDLREIRQNPQVNIQITERQAVALARQRFAGNILRISLIGEGGNQRYQIRMENEGKVFTVFVHATTGRVTGGG